MNQRNTVTNLRIKLSIHGSKNLIVLIFVLLFTVFYDSIFSNQSASWLWFYISQRDIGRCLTLEMLNTTQWKGTL